MAADIGHILQAIAPIRKTVWCSSTTVHACVQQYLLIQLAVDDEQMHLQIRRCRTRSRRRQPLIGRFLPEPGPFASRAAFFLFRVLVQKHATKGNLHFFQAPRLPLWFMLLCKKCSCRLCTALLTSWCGLGETFSPTAALLGRFLPRLGPFGSRTAPFLVRGAMTAIAGFADAYSAATRIDSCAGNCRSICATKAVMPFRNGANPGDGCRLASSR